MGIGGLERVQQRAKMIFSRRQFGVGSSPRPEFDQEIRLRDLPMSIFNRTAGLKRTAGALLLTAAMTAATFAQQPAGGGAQRGFQPEATDEPAAKNGHQYVVAI